MAEPLQPIGFWSYTRDDDTGSRGRLEQLWQALCDELQVHNVSPHRVHIFRDFSDIPLGPTWEQELDAALDRSSFLVPIVTPRFLLSEWCRKELLRFRRREEALGRNDLIFPIRYVDTRNVGRGWPNNDDGPELTKLLDDRQAIDFTRLRFDDTNSKPVALAIEKLAQQIQDGLLRSTKTARREDAASATPVPPAAGPRLAEAEVRTAVPSANSAVASGHGTGAARPDAAAEPVRSAAAGRGRSAPPVATPRPDLQPSSSPPWPPRTAFARWRDRIPGLGEDVCPEMITLPPGEFMMGAPEAEEGSDVDERPRQLVRMPMFALGRCAVTFGQWDAARAAGADLPYPDDVGWGRGDRPVINVSWHDAQAYCAWLNGRLGLATGGYRLPSEAEWEYACRAGTTGPFSFGETISTKQANYDGRYTYGGGRVGEYRRRTVPVGSLPANHWGLHQMHGNVWEWCEDWYGPYPNHATNEMPLQFRNRGWRVLRGGAWDGNPRSARSAFRGWNLEPGGGSRWAGFRLAKTLSV